MTQNAINVLTYIMAWGWRFLTGYYIPGTNVTPGALLLLMFLIVIVTRFIKRSINVPSGSTKEN